VVDSDKHTSLHCNDYNIYSISLRPHFATVYFKERRLECLRWKREALQVEERLADQRRRKIMEASRGVEEEAEENSEAVQQELADERVRSAFKNLVSRLKQSAQQEEPDVRLFNLSSCHFFIRY